MLNPSLRGRFPYQFVIYASIQFVVLTIIAMFIYPGGTGSDPSLDSYDFFRNFFSSLGLTVAPDGEQNWAAAILFFIALSVAGLGLVIYFIAEPQFFRRTRLLGALSILGSLFGVFCGVCFIGVAFTPANLLAEAHGWFVINAFRTFLLAVLFYIPAILLHGSYPKRYAFVYLLFALLLAGYIWLLFNGPGFDSPQGEIVQATGQKIIVYASIIAMLIQGYGSLKLFESGKSFTESS